MMRILGRGVALAAPGSVGAGQERTGMSEAAASSQSEPRDSRGGPPGGAAGLPSRTGKAVARRIDLSYHKRPHPMRVVRRALIIVALVVTVAWVVIAMAVRGQRIYNPGPVAPSHAMFENNCAVCHDGGHAGQNVATTAPATQPSGGFFKTVSDAARLRCHNADVHAPTQEKFVARLPDSTRP